MSIFKTPWLISAALLLVVGLFFKFCMRGYDYICYTLLFAALLIVLHQFLPVKIWKIVKILVCIGLAYFIAVEIPIIKNARGDKDCDKKYVVVLGAAVHGDVPSLALTHRLEGAYAYLKEHPDSVAILSGGQGAGENMSEAECMYFWLCSNGIPAERLIMESESGSTSENLDNSFRIIRELGDEPDGNTVLISSSYHLFRAKCLAKLKGAEVCTLPGNPGYPVYMLNCFIREAFGVTYLLAFGDK